MDKTNGCHTHAQLETDADLGNANHSLQLFFYGLYNYDLHNETICKLISFCCNHLNEYTHAHVQQSLAQFYLSFCFK